MATPLIPVGTICKDAKHGARCRIRGYRIGASASDDPGVEVTLLEDATQPVFIETKKVSHRKGAVVVTSLGKLTVTK